MLFRPGKTDSDHGELLRSSTAAFGVKLLAAGSAFLMNVVLARVLGATETGLFVLAYTAVTVAAALARIGLDNTLVRFIAASHAESRWPAIHSLYREALTWATLGSLAIAGLLWGTAEPVAEHLFRTPELAPVLGAMAWAAIPMAWYVLNAQALQGLRRAAKSVFLLGAALPILFTTLIWTVKPANAQSGAHLIFASAIVTAALARVWWVGARATPVHHEPIDRSWLFASCVPLLAVVISSQAVTWSSQIFLGIWSSPADVAIFNAAQRTALLTTFVLIAINSIAAPKFAAMYHLGELERLKATARHANKLMVALALPAVVIMLVAPADVLSAFGPEFRRGATALSILAAGQFINVATGSVAYLLMMTGRESSVRDSTLTAAAIAVVLGYLLIPKYGLTGAAAATAAAVAVQNLLCLWHVNRWLGATRGPAP